MDQVEDQQVINTVRELLFELVSITEKNVEGEKSVINEIYKSGLSSSESGAQKADLPVRRSSRIQRLSGKKDEKPIKRGQKSNKNSKTKNEVNSLTNALENIPVPDSYNQTNTQSSTTLESDKDKCKTLKIVKDSDIKVEKQDTKNNKMKVERKRMYRKRKHNPDDENTMEDNVNEIKATDVSVPDFTDNISIKNENSTLISSEAYDGSSHDGCKTSEVVSISNNPSESPVLDSKDDCSNLKPFKVKSRWCRSSELEGVLNFEPATVSTENTSHTSASDDCIPNPIKIEFEENSMEGKCVNLPVKSEITDVQISEPISIDKPIYEHIEENIYKFTRKKSKTKKQVRRMVCDCTLSKEEQEYGIMGCKEECLNRLLMIECGSRCPIGDACSNRKFTKKQYIKAEVFKTEKKGWGLKTLEDILSGDFLMEFVGEVLNHKEYRQRAKQYAKEKNVHCYFMALKTDEILDATIKGNYSRFINHSCDPNCETQKWTVNGELRVGVFAKRIIHAGEEFTLDYKFQRYGREAQKCFCLSDNCLGYIGGEKQISIDAYSGTKTTTSKKKRGVDDKKRDWEDMILEEEIEKLNSEKGLRNREETLKLARLMVRADDSATRHQILDIIIKTSQQACLRLFLDYHGLPLLWSWMTDIVDLDLKAKILQVLALLPIINKTMLLDSKVMSVVEKWVQEYNSNSSETKESQDLTVLPSSTDENSEPLAKKLKLIDFSDNETDSTDSHTAVDNSSENSSSVNENNDKIEVSPIEPLPTDKTITEDKSVLKEDPLSDVKTSISNIGSELLKGWKNLKEVFRIPKLEQQKRREDELEADHKVLKDIKIEDPVIKTEVTGDQIQVLISGKTDNKMTYHFEVPEMDIQEDRHKKLLPVPQNARLNRSYKSALFKKAEETAQRNIKEESDSSSLDSASPLLSTVTSPVVPPTNRPALLRTPTMLNQPPISFPPPINAAVPPHPQLDQPPQNLFPPQMVYPPAQAPYMVTTGPPPVLPPTTMPPPTSVFPQNGPMLSQPPPTGAIPPVNPGLTPHPTGYQLPPALPAPSTSQFMPSQVPGLPQGYPPGPSPYRNPSQPYYFLQQPSTVASSSAPATFSESVCPQTSSVLPVPTPNTMPLQSAPFSLSSACLPTQSSNPSPMQSVTPLPQPSGTSVPIHSSTYFPVEQLPGQTASPLPKEEPKPVKLPKSWRSAKDDEGNVYYYHSVTRETQWDPPTAEQIENESEDEDSDSEESDSSDTPTYDEPKVTTKHSRRKSKKRKATRPAADTTVSFPVRPEIAKKIKELFRTKMSTHIIHCLNSYRKPDCKVGRITSNEDFKYLARKLTHYTMTKELKQCKNVEDLDCNDCVMHKAKDFIKKYMSKYGTKYSRKEKFSPED